VPTSRAAPPPVGWRLSAKRDLRFAKFVVILNALVPGLLLAWDAAHGQLGANASNFALHTTGLLAFIFLLLALLVTPLRHLMGWPALIGFRRSLGLFAFGYACVHFLLFFALDRAFSVSSTVHEILNRRYLLIGTLGLTLMAPLALTSTNAMVMRLGARRWKRLHRLTYVVGIAAALHYYLLVKSDVRQPLVFAAVLAGLLAFRLQHWARARRAARTAPRAGTETRAAPVPAKGGFWSGELRVAEVVDETPDVRTFRMVPREGGDLPFTHRPGQYLNLALSIDGKRVNRSYTIASSPTRKQCCEITVKRSATGYASHHLHDQIRVGSTLKVSAPAGKFVFTGAEAKRVVLIAGGVGVTPLMSIIRYLTDQGWTGDIYFVFSARRRADLVFEKEWTQLQRRFPNLHVCPTLTKEESQAPDGWTGERGPISKALLTRFVPGWGDCPVFLCGPDGMMAAVTTMLRELGVPEANIHTEAFVSPVGSPAPEVSESPEPVASVGGRVRFARSALATESPSAKTILEIAEAEGLSLPFECRSGICGQCKTRLLSGQVTMDAEDALSPAEKARGLILACQAHPVGDVTVDA